MQLECGLVANLNRCMGCRTCQVACKQERGLGPGENGIIVWTAGPCAGDSPPAMMFLPMATEHCNLCRHRTNEGRRPFCVEICPTQALALKPVETILGLLASGKSHHLCKAGPDTVARRAVDKVIEPRPQP